MVKQDIAIVGAGIMGLAHACHAARAGLSVTVLDRNAQASGASVSNFGMLALVAQAPGAQRADALRAVAVAGDAACGAEYPLQRHLSRPDPHPDAGPPGHA